MAENLQGEEDVAFNKSWKLMLTLWGSEGKVVRRYMFQYGNNANSY